MFCPMTKEECTDDCAWFIEGECAVLGVCVVFLNTLKALKNVFGT